MAGVFAIAIVSIFSLLFLFPFYWMVSGSFKSQIVALTIPPEWFPMHPTIQNWVSLFKEPAWRWLLNSLIVAVLTMVFVCITSSMAGYSLSKKRFPGRKIIFWIFIAIMSLPQQLLLIPLFLMMTSLKWVNTYQGLILPAVGWPFGVFLMKQFTETLPLELLEAAKIDGCSEIRTFVSVVLPLVKSGIGALAIFTFMSGWNDYFWQLVMTRKTLMFTLPIGVASLKMKYLTDYGLLMAGSTIASLPMISIFLIFQKYFTQGITMGAVKG
jgi:multiple sugar transport system permease protein